MLLRKLFPFVFLVLLSACSEDDNPTPVNVEYLFSLAEVYDLSNQLAPPTLEIQIETIEEFPCINYEIDVNVEQQSGILTINILGIIESNACLTAIGPATRRISISETLNEIVVRKDGVEDRFSVNITEESMTVAPIVSSFIDNEFNVTFRYPERSFECVCGTTIAEALLCEEFRDELLLAVPTLEEFNFGAGKIPYTTGSSGHEADTPTTYYRYNSENDFDLAGQFLETFTMERIGEKDGITIRLTNWLNKSFRSWQLGG